MLYDWKSITDTLVAFPTKGRRTKNKWKHNIPEGANESTAAKEEQEDELNTARKDTEDSLKKKKINKITYLKLIAQPKKIHRNLFY